MNLKKQIQQLSLQHGFTRFAIARVKALEQE